MQKTDVFLSHLVVAVITHAAHGWVLLMHLGHFLTLQQATEGALQLQVVPDLT